MIDVAVHIVYCCIWPAVLYRAWMSKCGCIAIQYFVRVALRVNYPIHNDCQRSVLSGRIGDNHDFYVAKQARVGQYARRELRDTKGDAIAGQGAEILATIAQSGLIIPHTRDIFDGAIKRGGLVKGRRFSPQGLAHRFRRVTAAVQSLLGAVIQARNTLQAEEAYQAQRKLVIKAVWVGSRAIVETLGLVMVVQEGHKIVGGVAVCAENITLDQLALLVHSDHFRGREYPL